MYFSYSLVNMLSFFRKLSIGGKIKDGILPERIMEATEDLSIAKDQSALTLKTDTELKESVYGKLRTICVSCRASTFRILLDVGKTSVRHCVRRSPYTLVKTFRTVTDRYPHVNLDLADVESSQFNVLTTALLSLFRSLENNQGPREAANPGTVGCCV